jgi:NTP pyrophosphatase (non-canonical NTP hydrolase)
VSYPSIKDGPEHFEGPTPAQFSANVDAENYGIFAERTEAPYDNLNKELRTGSELPGMIIGALGASAFVGQTMDELKKFAFYGKAPKSFTNLHTWAHEFGVGMWVDPEVAARIYDLKIQRLIHVGSGLQTEASEFNEALLKYILEGKPIDDVNLMEELGDSLWYVGIGCRVLGVTLLAVLRKNISKLYIRYRSKFTAVEANTRNLASERATLEQTK